MNDVPVLVNAENAVVLRISNPYVTVCIECDSFGSIEPNCATFNVSNVLATDLKELNAIVPGIGDHCKCIADVNGMWVLHLKWPITGSSEPTDHRSLGREVHHAVVPRVGDVYSSGCCDGKA